jgi:putative transposase
VPLLGYSLQGCERHSGSSSRVRCVGPPTGVRILIVYEGKKIKKKEKSMPHPRTIPLTVSEQQQDTLQRLVHRETSPQRLVRRGKIILTAATGASNTKITQDLHVDHETVRLWRERWRTAESRLQAIEATGKQKLLSQAIEVLLTDEQRPGAPSPFTFEQFMQIMVLACEKPISVDVPVSTWTPRELADEAIKRDIVKTISPRTVERFLKGERFATSPQAVLAHATSRRSCCTDHTDSHRV